jgi:hypothetical protein
LASLEIVNLGKVIGNEENARAFNVYMTNCRIYLDDLYKLDTTKTSTVFVDNDATEYVVVGENHPYYDIKSKKDEMKGIHILRLSLKGTF